MKEKSWLISHRELLYSYLANSEESYPSLQIHQNQQWICREGHIWEETPAKFLKRKNCKTCTGKTIASGFNDLETTHPEIAKEYSHKNTIEPQTISHKSELKVIWLCPKNHEYISSIRNRTVNKTGCSVCAGKTLITGVNDFKTMAPELIESWHPDNPPAESIYYKSNQKFLWTCTQGHIWSTTPAKRYKGSGCHYCTNRLVLTHYNDLSTKAPEIAKNWDYSKNTGAPDKILYSSTRKVAWKCSICSASWESSPNYETRKDRGGCKSCQQAKSQLEEEFFAMLKTMTHEPILRNKRPLKENKSYYELDFWLPTLKIGFEVQDYATHSKISDTEESSYRGLSFLKKGPTYHQKKKRLAQEQLATEIIEIWEDEIRSSQEELKNKILKLLS